MENYQVLFHGFASVLLPIAIFFKEYCLKDLNKTFHHYSGFAQVHVVLAKEAQAFLSGNVFEIVHLALVLQITHSMLDLKIFGY